MHTKPHLDRGHTSGYRDALARHRPRLVARLETGRLDCEEVAELVAEATDALALHHLLGSPPGDTRWAAEVGARCGAALWRAAHLDGKRGFTVLDHQVTLVGEPRASELLWYEATTLAMIARSRPDLGVLRAPLTTPIADGGAMLRAMREGLSAYFRGDGRGTAAGFVGALTAVRDGDYAVPDADLDGVFLPALKLWDALFRRDEALLAQRLREACDAHRTRYHAKPEPLPPRAWLCTAAWAARSWAAELGMHIEIDDPHLPPLLES